MKYCLKICLPALLAIFAVNFGFCQSELTITHDISVVGNTKPIPVSLDGFSGEVADVLKFDLYVQGFSFVAPDAAQYQISGSAGANVTGSLTDKLAKKVLFSHAYTGTNLRRQAHALANEIVFAITGKNGIGYTQIAFKAQPTGNGAGEIYVSDFDGHSAQAVTKDNAIVSHPSWVPGRLALYYNSYKLENPDIFYHDLSAGNWHVVARYGGSNISPSASPDGSKVAMILSKDGSPDVYVCNSDGSNLKRLTTGVEDSSPCWSPDGQWVCFATKIGGSRRLAKVPAGGGAVQVISTSGAPNPTEPAWSPDGKWIAFTSQTSEFDICVMPADGSKTPVALAPGEAPSWAPNSRTLIFSHSIRYQQTLSVLDVFTKQVKDVGRIAGSDSEPSWRKDTN